MSCLVSSHKTTKIRSLKNYTKDDFLHRLKNANWESCFYATNVENASSADLLKPVTFIMSVTVLSRVVTGFVCTVTAESRVVTGMFSVTGSHGFCYISHGMVTGNVSIIHRVVTAIKTITGT